MASICGWEECRVIVVKQTLSRELRAWATVSFWQGLRQHAQAFWIAIALALILWAVLRFTSIGQGFMAIGFNERATILSGLPVSWLKVGAFALSGFFAGLAGLCVIAIGGAASSIGLGSDLLVPGIAAALVGGTAITGGICNPINVVFGAMFIALIPVGSAAVGVSPQSQSIVYGLVLIIAVAATASRSRGGIVK